MTKKTKGSVVKPRTTSSSKSPFVFLVFRQLIQSFVFQAYVYLFAIQEGLFGFSLRFAVKEL